MLATERYVAQTARWPTRGRHILAQFDDTTVVVYQAYRPSIGRFAAANQHFGGGGFSLSRMSWIKPNFLWMMYRCGWAQKEGQEVVLAIRITRAGFDAVLEAAVPSSYHEHRYPTRDAWQTAVTQSEVRLQWDPDHGPGGEPLERRAIQLGLRGAMLASYARDWIVDIEDITAFVKAQHGRPRDTLETPREDVYPCRASNLVDAAEDSRYP